MTRTASDDAGDVRLAPVIGVVTTMDGDGEDEADVDGVAGEVCAMSRAAAACAIATLSAAVPFVRDVLCGVPGVPCTP